MVEPVERVRVALQVGVEEVDVVVRTTLSKAGPAGFIGVRWSPLLMVSTPFGALASLNTSTLAS